MHTESQSQVRVVYSTLNVKHWMASLPSAADARPATCPCCEAPGCAVGGRVTVQGHGLRWRTQTGPDAVDGVPFDDEVPTRRYRCLGCGAVVTVLPVGLLPRTRYRPTAVVLALALWALGTRLASAAVRRRVSATGTVAHEAGRGWASLRRWARRGWDWWRLRRPARGLVSGRAGVEMLLQRLSVRARDGTGDLVSEAVAAAANFDGHGVCATPPEAPTS
jgi:hypothetical protein